MEVYRLRLDKSALDFSAAHFLMSTTPKCARLHGHNYHVRILLDGVASADGYVIDFTDVKRLAASVSAELDHRVLLPARSPAVRIEERNDNVVVSFCAKMYQFPIAEVVLLPVTNTTAECLAGWYATRLTNALVAEAVNGVVAVEVEIEESSGQSASVRYDLKALSAVTITDVASTMEENDEADQSVSKTAAGIRSGPNG